MWIYEYKGWPNFTWDSDIVTPLLLSASRRQGRLLGIMEGLGFELSQEAIVSTLTSDVLKSWAIEGERLDASEVRSSIARRLGVDVGGIVPSSREVDGIVEMMLDATGNYGSRLTKGRLFDWHRLLFPLGYSNDSRIRVGSWRRDVMEIISGRYGSERVHYVAPDPKSVNREMSLFLRWFGSSDGVDLILKAGISHLWFEIIHPFDDGNGRIGRAISDMMLSRSDGTGRKFYSLSSQFEAERSEYYDELNRQQCGNLDITGWLVWFLGCLERSFASSELNLSGIMFKSRLWDSINRGELNRRQHRVISRMVDDSFEGYMTTPKYMKFARCPSTTALRDISDLHRRRILLKNRGRGKNTSYRLTDDAEKVRV